jgi:hypothetical protein
MPVHRVPAPQNQAGFSHALALPSRRDVSNRLEALIDDYLAHCFSEGRGRNTAENAYGYPLRHVFLPWCAREGIDQPSQLTRASC